jgi:hypothetical protein
MFATEQDFKKKDLLKHINCLFKFLIITIFNMLITYRLESRVTELVNRIVMEHEERVRTQVESLEIFCNLHGL